MSLARVLARQAVAISIALVLVFLTDQVFSFWPEKTVSLERDNYWYNNWGNPLAKSTFEQFLANNDIVLFGSSELSEPVPQVVHRFFPEELRRPLFAFGSAGAQSLIILIQLLEHEHLLNEQSKIVVILSPWWFLTKGTHPGAMNTFVDKGALGKIYFDRDLSSETKEPIKNFMDKRLHEFSSPSLERLVFKLSPRADSLLGHLASFVTVDFPGWIHSNSQYYKKFVKPNYTFPAPDSRGPLKYSWERALEESKAHQLSISGSNEYGFEDSVWPSFRGTVPRELKSPQEDSSEYKDLEALVGFLRSKKVKALFINQPVNPLAYTNVDRFDKLNARITGLMQANGMSYVDFMALPYEKGTLKDLAHFSAYGWTLTNLHIETWLKEHGWE